MTSLPEGNSEALDNSDGEGMICWHPLRTHGFASVHWGIRFYEWYFGDMWLTPEFRRHSQIRYWEKRNATPLPNLVCNGIIVSDDQSAGWLQPVGLSAPFLSVVESARELPLNLQRNALEAALPFESELLDDGIRALIAFAILFAPQSNQTSGRKLKYDLPVRHEYVCCEEGVTLFDQGLIRRCGIDTIVGLLPGQSSGELPPVKWRKGLGVMMQFRNDYNPVPLKPFGRAFTGGARRDAASLLQHMFSLEDNEKIRGKRLRRTGRGPWQATFGSCPPTMVMTSRLRLSRYSVIESYPVNDANTPSRLETIMCELTGDGIIPYSVVERRHKLAKAIADLEPFLALYREAAQRLESGRARFDRPLFNW